ncbi:Zinc finger protein CONSTANS-LIKE 13 [Morus notabilis]|uniref:Zinc finger protein CONSTANS-LIKE 13 n=2 Tax=Morus notabilis TaxID=981085 RepID=W9SZQ5_9ROSA|nr:zinc finger protein CONSTANS-LIKE 13 [Morus notabilis]EXC34703.1 Zinc finger protein CONSTANS-LIKE 13 [Morus notabilis]
MTTSSQRRLCDYCDDTTAVLYCRADSAKLCFSCDREVHGTNQLFAKHARSQLCDACDDAPASIFCTAESSVLCQNCDWERHNDTVSVVHHRRPLEGFNGCPSVTELLAILGFEDVDKKGLFWAEENGFFDRSSDLLMWDVPSVVGLDDLIVSDSSRSFQAMGIPPLPKNRNAVCGQHKEEILSQLRELAKKEPDSSNYENVDLESLLGFEAIVPDPVQPGKMCVGSHCEAEEEPNTFSAFEARTCQWCINCSSENVHQDVVPQTSSTSRLQESCRDSEKHSDMMGDSVSHANDAHNQHPVDSNALPDFPKTFPCELTSQERETAISRYKEKRKTRRYEKRIRYESRKVRAESRTRIKGRFAKIGH